MTCLTPCRTSHPPRTSRDAGPYLARRLFASGWGLAVSGLIEAAPAKLVSALDSALWPLSLSSVIRTPYSALRLPQVGLTVPVGRASCRGAPYSPLPISYSPTPRAQGPAGTPVPGPNSALGQHAVLPLPHPLCDPDQARPYAPNSGRRRFRATATFRPPGRPSWFCATALSPVFAGPSGLIA